MARLSRRFTRRSVHPRSLAATDGIAVAFFSCAYLDVSVLHVRSSTPIHSGLGIPTSRDGLPHSDIHGSRLVYQLPVAFRRLPRPSSPLDAKTSTMCPYGLVAPTGRRDSSSGAVPFRFFNSACTADKGRAVVFCDRHQLLTFCALVYITSV